ncbi:MAG: MlaE family lipid ABC transporter permease subunit [Legionellales bacterium]|nr:MlaE family lipid ABC transporter permease subunit [Legionellales bacterium]
MDETTLANWVYHQHTHTISCKGMWIAEYCHELPRIEKNQFPQEDITIDVTKISQLDSVGALALCHLAEDLTQRHFNFKLIGFNDEQQTLFNLIRDQHHALEKPASLSKHSFLYRLGKMSFAAISEGISFLSFLGETVCVRPREILRMKSLFFKAIIATIDKTGFRALLIVGLLSILIGVVLAYQMGVQLQSYGAEIYIVDLLGIAIFREFGPLITAIIIAGRTSSSFTAEIGTMKAKEELDALRTLGLSPTRLLVLPKILGLMIALPLLTVWADGFGVLGGMLMSKSMLGISYADFLIRFKENVALRHLLIGLSKAPVFALLIASVGCFEGFRVTGSAESVGQNTTKSVVIAIFLIIVTDAAFSILFSWNNL